MEFNLPMNRKEKILGWIWFPIHVFGLGAVLSFLMYYICPLIDVEPTTALLNVVYYAVSFLFLLGFLFSYLRLTFWDLCDNLWGCVKTFLFGYLVYNILLYAVVLLLSLITKEQTNPNEAAVVAETMKNRNMMLAVSIFLAPVVEEILFRGVVFGTIRTKNRVLAYVVSIVLFALYHLWEYFLDGFSPALLLTSLEYLPGGLVLAWVYDRSGSLWPSVFMHMLINAVAMYATIAL